MATQATINDVAERAGVSKATVSAVLNDTGTVKDSTRDTVLQAMKELNYRPRASARRGFRSSDSRSLGVVIKEADNPYYSRIIEGIRAYAEGEGYSVLVGSSEGRYDNEQHVVELFKAKDVDGLIIFPVMDGDTDLSYLFELRRRNFPFVVMAQIHGVKANLVDVDNVAASRIAAEYLIEQGHTRIVHFAGPSYSLPSRERVEGIRRCFSGTHLAFTEDMVVPTGASLEDGYRTGLGFFGDRTREDWPTAVSCFNDLVAIGLMRALRELDIRIAEDVSVIGCDDVNILEYLETPLTTIRLPKRTMGQRAAEVLIRHLKSDKKMEPEEVHLHGELVVRSTVQPPVEALERRS